MSSSTGYNWFLILVTAIVGILILAVCVYVIVDYQHPEDRNQAYIPKLIVLLGLFIAVASILLFPLDIANNNACSESISPSSCNYTLPMKQIWYAVFGINLILCFLIIPFTLFFYEADSDYNLWQKMKSAIAYTLAFLVFLIVIIACAYGLAGYVVYPTQQLTSGLASMSYINNLSAINTSCIIPVLSSNATVVDNECTVTGSTYVEADWQIRVSLPVYVMALQSVMGWFVFLVFAGIGIFATPIDWLQQFLGRPRSVITKSEYMSRARIIAQRAKQILSMAEMMRRGDRDRRWRSNLSRLQREIALLEDDEFQLERVFPQGEDGDSRWVLFMLSFWLLLFMAVVGFGISCMWVAQIVVYMLPPNPIYPLLNTMFVDLDDAFPLFGTLAFAIFCLYLLVAAMKGNFMLGLNFLVIKLYPMRPGATMMSSFLVNTAIVLIMAPAILQFCAQAFAIYADGSTIYQVFGTTVLYLKGISAFYKHNVFLYLLLAFIGLSAVFLAFRGRQMWKRRDPMAAYSMIN